MPIFPQTGAAVSDPFYSGDMANPHATEGLADVLAAATMKEGRATHSIGGPGPMLTLRREVVMDVQASAVPRVLFSIVPRRSAPNWRTCERSLARLKSGEMEMISAT